MTLPTEVAARGGKWLGAVRSWMQWNCVNGESVTWGSDAKIVRRNHEFTVKDIEDIGAHAAAGAINDVIERSQALTALRSAIDELRRLREGKTLVPDGELINRSERALAQLTMFYGANTERKEG